MDRILCPDDESVSASAKRIERLMMREIVKGQKAATQLKLLLLLEKPFTASTSAAAEELAANVLRSFTLALSALTSGENRSPAAEDSGSSGSGECRKKRSLTTAKKGGRGRYERRRTAQTWTIVSPTADDEHSWRKYGQKEILNSKFPRSYFRCSRKREQGCQATKLVQRSQEHPDMYQTTYIGTHTCTPIPKTEPQLVMEDSKVPIEQNHTIISSPATPTIKQEHSKEDTDRSDDVWSYLEGFEPLCN